MTLKSKHIIESDSYADIETAEKGEDLQEPFDDVSEPPKGIKI